MFCPATTVNLVPKSDFSKSKNNNNPVFSTGFHIKCVDPWLTKTSGICPMCRQRIVPEVPKETPIPLTTVVQTEENETEPLTSPEPAEAETTIDTAPV